MPGGSKKNYSTFSETAAIEVLGFYAQTSKNVRYIPGPNELIIHGLAFGEQLLLKQALISLGAEPATFETVDTDDGEVVLHAAKNVARRLAAEDVPFDGRSVFQSGSRGR